MRAAAQLVAAALAAACTATDRAAPPESGPAVTGTVTYLERIALPEDARLQLELFDLEEVGRDGSARIAAETTSLRGRSVPVEFRLALDDAELSAGGSYALTARIDAAGGTMFRTPRPTFVLTNDAPSEVSLLLRRAGGGPAASPELTATHWHAKTLDGQPVVPLMGRRRPFLVLQGPEERYVGHGGANRFRGTYERDGEALRFRAGTMTRMGGEPQTMALEHALLGSLTAARSFSIAGDELTLHGEGGPVAVFEAGELR